LEIHSVPNTSEVLKRRDGLHVREIDGETVILDQDKEQMHSLNPTAAFIFEEIDGRRTVDEICRALADSFNVSLEVAARDTRALVDQLRKLDLIT
jgi:hypothetical protein